MPAIFLIAFLIGKRRQKLNQKHSFYKRLLKETCGKEAKLAWYKGFILPVYNFVNKKIANCLQCFEINGLDIVVKQMKCLNF